MSREETARSQARVAVLNAVEEADDELLRSLLCQVLGHPPVVHSCFGELTCARCGDRVGDTLMSGSSLVKRAVVGHACRACRAVWSALSAEQLLLMPEDVVAEFGPKRTHSPRKRQKS